MKKLFAREELALEAAEKPAVHLGVHFDFIGHIHHRAASARTSSPGASVRMTAACRRR
jgi:hypothetical protein